MKREDTIEDLEEAIHVFESIACFRDANDEIERCKNRIEEIKAEEKRKKEEKARQEAARIQEANRRKWRNKMIASVSGFVVVAIVVVFVILLNTVIIPNGKYNTAMEYYESGDYATTYKYNAFEKAGIEEEHPTVIYEAAENGDIVEFSGYNWIVLNKTEDTMLIIAEDVIEEKAYNEEYEAITWEECTLRTYLNGTFYNSFSEEEQEMIVETKLTNSDNPEYDTDGGNDTTDKIFLR